MLEDLEKLASEIGHLNTLADGAQDLSAAFMIKQMAQVLEWTLTEMSECEGTLAGDMPWWREWPSAPSNS